MIICECCGSRIDDAPAIHGESGIAWHRNPEDCSWAHTPGAQQRADEAWWSVRERVHAEQAVADALESHGKGAKPPPLPVYCPDCEYQTGGCDHERQRP